MTKSEKAEFTLSGKMKYDKIATEEDYATEFLDYILAVKEVESNQDQSFAKQI